MIQVKFTKFGANSAFGGFSPGDKMRCSKALAAHLVELGCAKYDEVAPAEQVAQVEQVEPEKPKRKGKK